MKITIVDDNNVIGFYKGEWGLSMCIEVDGEIFLFDTGYSDNFLKNLMQMNYDIDKINAIILSHGHNDHTRGLKYLIEYYNRRGIKKEKRPSIIAHPDILNERRTEKGVNIGLEIDINTLLCNFNIIFTKKPYSIRKNIIFLGEIKMNSIDANGDDAIKDDSGLVFCGRNGIVVISGCAHSGICNTIEYARKITDNQKVQAVIGGFHMLSPSYERMNLVKDYLLKIECDNLFPCHCTDFQTKIFLSKSFSVKAMGVGISYEFL